MKVADENIQINFSEELGLTLENLFSVTELLTRARFLTLTLTALQLIVSGHILQRNWNRKQVTSRQIGEGECVVRKTYVIVCQQRVLITHSHGSARAL